MDIVEVVAALIWDNDKFMISSALHTRHEGFCGSLLAVRWRAAKQKSKRLIRECKEELAVTLTVGEKFMDVVHEYPDITVHLTLFNATIAEGVPQLLEHNDIK